ncbi:glutamate decarboxylase 4-like [Pyrus x bretschneideri]|uniref:glutamate decarboxylase 4-like n=1 Tax=Pyrus x bretschneideri TaxID=225117 RepID=UPI00202FFAF0|nr:glutamate decarboxylase 4-like [Pyrus x bretschneideri]XP_048429049.1 glutamate decarboxylase 4-like [Pyrus x bretschneideri]
MVVKEGGRKTGRFKILSRDIGVLVVAFSLKDRSRYNEFKVSEGLRRHQFIVPAYHMSADAKHVALLRVVIRGYFSCTKTEGLLSCINAVLKELDELHPVAAIQENGHHKLSLKGVANGNGELPPAAYR